MSKFDTHGGYFAPKDYMRVNEGGSHEENPNGGVQVGVDPEGTPNLLEEGEPVYKDYVYSDNIEAEKEFLEQNNLPAKYTGKLYSKIADDLFSEAEERPLDPISRNGLEALLGRLADAQEGQKQAKEQRDLENELANLSPEELDQLEMMLAQGEQGQMAPEQMPMGAVPEEQMMGPAEPMPVEGMPMMGFGGPFRRNKGLTERMVESVRDDAGLMSEDERRNLARKKLQDKIDMFWRLPTPNEIENLPENIKNASEEYIRKRNERQRKYEDSKFYRKLNEFDDKYLDNMWLHPYYELEAPLFKKFNDGGDIPPGGALIFNPETGTAYNPYLGGPNDNIPMLIDENGNLVDYINPSVSVAYPGKSQAWVDAQTSPFVRGIRDSRDRFAEKYGLPVVLGLAGGPGGAITALGGQAVDTGVNVATRGEKDSWGEMLVDPEEHPYLSVAAEFTNPAYTLSGLLAAPKSSGIFRRAKDFINGITENEYKYAKSAKNGIWKVIGDSFDELNRLDDAIDAAKSEVNKAKKAKVDSHRLQELNEEVHRLETERNSIAKKHDADLRRARDVEPIKKSSSSVNNNASTSSSSQKPETPNTNGGAENKKKINPWKAFGTSAAVAAAAGLGFEGYRRGRDFISDLSENGSPAFGPYPLDTLNTGSPVDTSAVTASPDTIKIGGGLDLGFLDEIESAKALGGKINRFDEGGDAYRRFMKLLTDYGVSKNRGGIEGMYRIDRNFDPYLRGNKNLGALEHDPRYVAFTDLVKKKAAEGNRRALMYLSQLDNGVADWTDRLFDQNGNLRNGWEAIYDDRRYDGDAGIYHLIPEFNDVSELEGFFDDPSVIEPNTSLNRGANPYDWYRSRAYNVLGAINPAIASSVYAWKDPNVPGQLAERNVGNGSSLASSSEPGNGSGSSQQPVGSLPTWPRYAGAIGSGLLGLYNAFQSPDRYVAPHINPQVPEGRINLQNQVYNPVDQNMVANAQIAQGNATNRALRNSGLGPSAGAAILAADNNTTGNLGTGFLQTWDANNQRRNAVIAANNQAEAQRAQFDYTVDAARKEAFNRFAPYNAQIDLTVQRLNNQAEADKYTAISNQIGNGLQALSGIGQENFAMNQINTNPAFLGYRVGPNGVQYYFNPSTGQYEPVKKS